MTKILVVEDETVVAADIAQSLKRGGYDVPAVAATGEAALRMTAELHPDLVLMDIELKGEKDGIETAREIEDQFEIPIIFLTGQTDESTLTRIGSTSHYGFLLKPIDAASLFPTVEMALTKHAFSMRLMESESRFRAVTDSAADAIFSIDAQGNVIYWNKAAERTFGWTADDIIGQSVTAILPESAKDGFLKMLPALSTRETYVPSSFMLWRRKDDTEFPAEPSFASWKTREGTFATAIVRDISEQKAIIESVQTGIVLIDPITHRIVDVNTTAARLFGASKEAIIGSVCHRFICPAEVGRCPITDLEQNVDNAERVLLTADGKSLPILKSVSEITLRGHAYLLESFIDISDRKQIEHTLVESEAYYRAIFESTATGMAIVEEDMTVAMVNSILEQLTGFRKNEVEGLKPWTDFVAPEDLELMKTYHRTRRRDEGSAPKGYEFRLLTKDGMRREAFLTVALIPGTQRSVVSIVDLTALKTAQEAVRKQARMLDAAHDCIMIFDDVGTLTYWNRGAERLYGWTKQEAEGQNVHALLQTTFAESLEALWPKLLKSGAWDGELTHVTRDGVPVTVTSSWTLLKDEKGNVSAILEISSDITERKKAQLALADSEAKLRTTFASMADGIVINGLDRKVTDCNEAVLRLTQRSREEIIGKPFTDLLAPEFRSQILETIPELLEQGAIRTNSKMLRKNGESVDVEANVSVITDAAGQPTAFLTVTRDVTERKKAQLALAESEAKLRTTFATMVDGIVLTGLDEKVIDCNEAILRLTQRSREEIIGKPFVDIFVAPEFRSQILETIPELLEKGAIRTYSKLLRKNGESVDLEANVSVITDAAGQPTAFLTVTRDVTERMKAESVLHKAQEELRQDATVFNAAHDAILTLDPEGTITYWNRGAERLYGWTTEEAKGQNANALLRTQFPESREALWPKLLKSGLWEGELLHITRDGVPVTVTSSWTLLKDEKGNVSAILEISSDITERKKAQLALADSEAKLRTTFASMADGVVTGGLDWKVTDCNEAILRITQRSKEEVIGKPFADLLTPEARSQILETIPDLMEKGTIRTTDKMLRKRGESVDVEANVSLIADAAGQPTAFLAVIRDVTERMKAELALAESEAKLRITFATMADGIVIVGLDERVIDCNEAILRLTQRSREEIIGKPSADLLAPEFRSQIPNARKFLVGSILTRTTPGHGEKGGVRSDSQLLRKNGESVDIEANISVIEDAVGQPAALLIVARDVTERKKMEQQLNSTLADLQRSNAELEQFAYIASHDLQEPLRMITSYIQIIEEDYKGKLEADADQYIAFTVEGAKRMQTLIDDLLAYSRVGTRAEPFMPISMSSVLSEAIANLEVAIEESHAVVTHDQLPTVLGDESQLIQLFQNLIGNAIKFKGDDAPTIHVGVEETKDDWVFSVRDNGIGIDMKYAERIFTVFQRLHSREEYEGTGIGLAVVKKIVERHGGRIWVESTPAKGSTFFFTLRKREDSM